MCGCVTLRTIKASRQPVINLGRISRLVERFEQPPCLLVPGDGCIPLLAVFVEISQSNESPCFTDLIAQILVRLRTCR